MFITLLFIFVIIIGLKFMNGYMLLNMEDYHKLWILLSMYHQIWKAC